MNFIIWLVVGGLIGWIASMIMRTDAQQGVILLGEPGIGDSARRPWDRQTDAVPGPADPGSTYTTATEAVVMQT